MHIFLKKKSGMSLVEVIIALAITLLISSVLVFANLTYFRTSTDSIKDIKAIYLTEEGVEVITFLAKDWNNLGEVDVDYYLFWTGLTWVATTTENYIDQIYKRKFFTEVVNRDNNNDIVLSGGSPDLNTRKLTVQVAWSDNKSTSTKSISSYLMKLND